MYDNPLMAERLMSDGTDYIDTEQRPTSKVARPAGPDLNQYNAQMAEYRRQRAAVEAAGGNPNTVRRPIFSQGVLLGVGEEEARMAAQRTARAGGVAGTQEDNLAALKEAFGMKKTRMLLDKLPEGEEPHIVEIPEGGFVIEAAIPKSAEGKIKWMRKVLADIEEQDADTQGDPIVTQRRDSMLRVIGYLMSDRYKEEELLKHKPTDSGLLTYRADLEDYNANLKIGKRMHDEFKSRLEFHGEFLAFSGEANKAEDVFIKVAGKLSGDQKNVLLHIPEFAHALNYYQQMGETFSDRTASSPQLIKKDDDSFDFKAGWADEQGNLYDYEVEGSTLVDTAEKAHDAFRKRLKAALVEESGIETEDIEWAANLAERFWRISGKRALQMRAVWNPDFKPKNKAMASKYRGAYQFLDSTAKGDDVLKKLFRFKEWSLSEGEIDNLRINGELMGWAFVDGEWKGVPGREVNLKANDYLEEMVGKVDDMRRAAGFDLEPAFIKDNDGKVIGINFVKLLELEIAERARRERERDLSRLQGEEVKDEKDDYLVNYGKFADTEFWGLRKVMQPDAAREALVGTYLATPSGKALLEVAKSFSYLKAEQYIQLANLLENHADFLVNAPREIVNSLGLKRPDRAETDIFIQRLGQQLKLTPEEALKRANNILGTTTMDKLLLLVDYYPADDFIKELILGLILGYIQAVGKVK